ncbi:tail tube [Vibrio phage K469]
MNEAMTNDASSNNWSLIGADDKIKLMTAKVTGFSIPGMSTEGTTGPNMGGLLADIGSDTIMYDPFTFIFIVDENYANYRKIFKWMKSNAVSGKPTYVDFMVRLLDNQQKTQKVTLEFTGCRPTMLGDVTLDTIGGEKILVCSITMKFEDMDFIEE